MKRRVWDLIRLRQYAGFVVVLHYLVAMYRVYYLDAGIEDNGNDGSDQEVHDGGPPRVERVDHKNNVFEIFMNEKVDASTLTDSVEITYGSSVIDGTIELTGDSTIRFSPNQQLGDGVEYRIEVTDVQDMAGKVVQVFYQDFKFDEEDLQLDRETLIFEYSILTENDHSLYGNDSLMHGRTYEPGTGLYYYRNRYYHPELHRFLQPDPLGYEDSMNPYQAFNNNPVNYTDPFGLSGTAGPQLGSWIIQRNMLVAEGKDVSHLDYAIHRSSRDKALVVEGTINVLLSASQWFSNMLMSAVTPGYMNQSWNYTTLNFTGGGDFFQISQDTRSAGGKIVGAVTDPIKGVSSCAANYILACDPAISPEYRGHFYEDAVRQTPGAVIAVATTAKGARFAASKINLSIKSSPYFENTVVLMDQAFDAFSSYNTNTGGLGKWVIKNEYLGTGASFQFKHAPNSRGMTYRVPFKNPNPKGRMYIDFDDFIPDLNSFIDYKKSVRTTKKGLNQAQRHMAISKQTGIKIIWRVPNRSQALRARAFFKRKGITGIEIEVVK